MKPRALVFTLFGDYLRYCGGGVRLGAISELLGLFGVDPATSRVVMSRLRRDGWFDTAKNGRETLYRLSDSGWRLLDEGRDRIFRHSETPWSRRWSMVLVRYPESQRAARDEARRSLSWLGYGQLSSSTWMSPRGDLDAVERALRDSPTLSLDLLTCESRGIEHDRSIARRCWDLEALDDDYRAFVEKYESVPELRGRDALTLRVQLTDDYRQFPFRDPDLPAELVPHGWHGHRAHRTFAELHTRLAAEGEAELTRIVGLPIEHDAYLKQLLDDRRLFVAQSSDPAQNGAVEAATS